MGHFSDFLYPQPSFAEGAARILDFGNSLTAYNQSGGPDEADEIALRADVAAVGADMRQAADRVKQEESTSAIDWGTYPAA